MVRHRPPTFSQDLEDVLAGPLIHRLAADTAEVFTRRRTFPLAMHLGYMALQRAIGSANRLDAEFANPAAWQRAVEAYNRGTRRYGDGRAVGHHLPPINANAFRCAREALTSPDHLPTVLAAVTARSVEIAVSAGLLPESGGSLTHPDRRRTIYGDGTIVRPLYRPDTPGRTDPDIAEHHNHQGAHWGQNYVLVYCRGNKRHQRVILGVAWVDKPGREAATAVELFTKVVDAAPGRVQAIVYDGAFRGVHHNELMRRLGVLVITKVHAGARRDGTKIVRTIPLDTRTHEPDGLQCSHTLVIHDGAIREAAIDAEGELQLSTPLTRKQVRRTRSERNGYRFTLGVNVPCPRAPFVSWFSVHPHADQLRLLPEGDPDFRVLYGLRNDAESNNNSYKRTLPGRRAASLGWRRQLLDVAAWGILVNSRAYARHATDPPGLPLEVVGPGLPPLDGLLGPVRSAPAAPPAPACEPAPSRSLVPLWRQLIAALLGPRPRPPR